MGWVGGGGKNGSNDMCIGVVIMYVSCPSKIHCNCIRKRERRVSMIYIHVYTHAQSAPAAVRGQEGDIHW